MKTPVNDLTSVSFGYPLSSRRRVYLLFKDFSDRIAALFALFLLSPLLVLVAFLLRFCVGSPVLFRQQRSGYRGHPFWLLKFRTMSNAKDENGILLSDRERLTRLGAWLRLLLLMNCLHSLIFFVGR